MSTGVTILTWGTVGTGVYTEVDVIPHLRAVVFSYRHGITQWVTAVTHDIWTVPRSLLPDIIISVNDSQVDDPL